MPFSDQLSRLRVVLVGTRNPLNIGAAARAMSNFGVTQLRLVTPYEKAFQNARSAVGAADILEHAEVFDTLPAAIADCSLVVGTTAARRRELNHPAHRVETGSELLRTHLASETAALMFGSERFGLSTNDLSYSHWTMSIVTPGTNASLNLGQAVAVCLHELVREASGEPAKSGKIPALQAKPPAANSEEIERVTQSLFDVLRKTRYWHPGGGDGNEEKVRRLILRMQLSAADAEVVLGMCRQILWKIKKTEEES